MEIHPVKKSVWLAVLGSCLLATSPVAADELVRFTVPATSAGIRGNAAVTYHGYAHPKYRFNFTTSAVFSDPDLPGNVIMIAKSGDNSIDPATGQEIPSADTQEVLVGRSIDGGNTFHYRRILKWTNGRRMVRVAMVPDPDRFKVWVGTAQMFQNVPDDPVETFLGTTRIEIDWQNKKVRLLANENPTIWNEYNLDKLNPPDPLFFTTKQFDHIAKVTLGSQTRYEAWGSIGVSPGSSPPCATNEYQQNVANWPNIGRRIVWYHFDPSNGVDLTSEKLINSSVRLLPTAYARSDKLVTRAEFGNEEFLYVGTQEQIVCDEIALQNSDGTSIRFIRLSYDALNDNYTEEELDYLLDIANPLAPNWSCANSRVRCAGDARVHYGMVNAIPYQSGGQLQLYVSAWTNEAPTLPAIGEVGTTTATQNVKTVNLINSYSDPVVFVQPPSYNDQEPVIARITNVTASSFQVRLQEDSGLDGIHPTESLSYVVLERGTYRLSDRRVLEVDKVATSVTIPSSISWTSDLDLEDSFGNDTGAVVLTQLQTSNDSSFAKTRQTGIPTVGNKLNQCNPLGQCGTIRVATAGFGIERDEASQRAGIQHGAVEEVGILLIGETWQGRNSSIFPLGPWGAQGFDVRRVSGVGGIGNYGWTPVTFEQPHIGNLESPAVLAWSDTRIGGNPASLRYRNLASTGVEVTIDEDQAYDSERNHLLESVVYWVIGRGTGSSNIPKVIRAQPIDPITDLVF